MTEILITIPLEEALVEDIQQVSKKLSITVHPARQGDEVPAELWEKAEAAFRLMAFHEYYRRSKQKNNSLRFAQAILDSARPITSEQKRQVIMQWYKSKDQKPNIYEGDQSCALKSTRTNGDCGAGGSRPATDASSPTAVRDTPAEPTPSGAPDV